MRIEPSQSLKEQVSPETMVDKDENTITENKNLEIQRQIETARFDDEIDQFLMFELNQDDYCLDILSVREILDIPYITHVPRTPQFLLGVINLRGTVVPVVDLNLRFGLEKGEKTENTCIVIVEIEQEGAHSRVFGLLVDAVQQVINLPAEKINEVSRVGVQINTGYLQGIGNHEGKFILILDLFKVLPINESF